MDGTVSASREELVGALTIDFTPSQTRWVPSMFGGGTGQGTDQLESKRAKYDEETKRTEGAPGLMQREKRRMGGKGGRALLRGWCYRQEI